MTKCESESQKLLREIQNGSIEAFSQFYDRFAGLVYGIALKITNSREDAEDICHEVFLEVYKKAGDFDPTRGSVEAWLSIQARSRSLDLLRRKRQQALKENSAYLTGRIQNTEEQVIANFIRTAVQTALQQLPAAQRQALYGSFYEERSHSELAEEMNRPLGTVKSLIRYGIKNLRKQLEQIGWYQSSEERGNKYGM